MATVGTTAGAMPPSFLLLVDILGTELAEFLAAEMLDAEHRLLRELTPGAFHKSPRVCESLLQKPGDAKQIRSYELLDALWFLCLLPGAHHLPLFFLRLLRFPYRRFEPEALCRRSPPDVRGGMLRVQGVLSPVREN